MIATQPTLPIDWFLVNTRRALGAAGEIAVAQALVASGYLVDNPHNAKAGDLSVFDSDGHKFKVEVKTARLNTEKRFCFTLYKRWQGRECADHRSCDFVVLLCVLKSGAAVPFVLPTSAVRFQKSIAIGQDPRGYAGKYAQYRQSLKELRLK